MPSHAAWALWFLGQPDKALERMNGALTLAHELSEPHGLAHALFFAAILYQLRREPRIAQELAEEAVTVSSEHGLVLYEAMATTIRGWALNEQGRQEEGIEQMRQGIAANQATGTAVGRPRFLAMLAQALGRQGQTEEGLGLLEEAMAIIGRNGERYYQAELYRLKGELLLKQSTVGGLSRATTYGKAFVESEPEAVTNAEESFHHAIKIAQRQNAKSWELRAVMSLARLYRNRGKQQQARSLLMQIYDRFTEGFKTVDLREAKTLLDELS